MDRPARAAESSPSATACTPSVEADLTDQTEQNGDQRRHNIAIWSNMAADSTRDNGENGGSTVLRKFAQLSSRHSVSRTPADQRRHLITQPVDKSAVLRAISLQDNLRAKPRNGGLARVRASTQIM